MVLAAGSMSQVSISHIESLREVRICDAPGRLLRPLLQPAWDRTNTAGWQLLCLDAQEEATWALAPPISEQAG